MEPAIGIITMFAGNYAPKFWAFCQGQILPIAQNTALFSILGTTYGGNGVQNFALPNFIGRSFLGVGQGPGLTSVVLGEQGGAQTATLTTTNLREHTHTATLNIAASSSIASVDEPAGAIPAAGAAVYTFPAGANDQFGGVTATTGATGSGTSFNIRQPYLVVNFIICLNGIFPSRN